MTTADILGFLAGLVSTLSFLPQVVKVWRSHSTKSISSSMYILYGVSILLWTAYAWVIHSWPLFLSEVVTGLMVAYILIMTLRGTGE